MRRLINICLIASVTVWTAGCDIYGTDAISGPERLTAKIYSTDRGVGIVDLAAAYPGYDYKSLSVVTNPNAGIVQRADNLLLYTPTGGSVADQFTVKMQGNGREVLLSGQIIPKSVEQCAKDPVKYVSIRQGESVTIDLFDSKDFCGYDRTSTGGIGTCVSERENGETNVAPADIALVKTLTYNYAVFTYSPEKGFTGRYRLKYTVVSDLAEHPAGDESWCTDPTKSKYYSQNEIVIDVTP